MMLMMRDDDLLELFARPERPPMWVEASDVAEGVYSFCDEEGQCYIGVVTEPSGWFKPGSFRLQPVGEPDPVHVLTLLERARGMIPNRRFATLDDLRDHLRRRVLS